ncbi:MAG: hypothetical protein KC656_17855, partial [Myxococcales bacterium]|nr:hypothetical protein [Myxococcales bacterium]
MKDLSTLTGPVLAGFLADVDAALGRLLAGGLAHPDAELPPTFELLAGRAEQLGSPTAREALSALASGTSALLPGPPERDARDALSRALWDEVLAFHAWLRWFRLDIGLSTAAAVSAGAAPATDRDDLPRFTGRLWLDGLELEGQQLLLHAHDADGAPFLLVDPLAGLDPTDPFTTPVVSRLLQDEVVLAGLGAVALDVDRHPVGHRGGTAVLRPDLRGRPVLRPASREGQGRQVSRMVVEARMGPEGPVLAGPLGEDLTTGDVLSTNLLKRLAGEGTARTTFQATVRRGRAAWQILSVPDLDGLAFPHVDPAAWALDADVLFAWTREAPALQGPAQLFVSGVAPRVQEALAGPARTWFDAWVAARLGIDREPRPADAENFRAAITDKTRAVFGEIIGNPG